MFLFLMPQYSMPWKGHSAFGLLACLLVHHLLAAVVSGADAPVVSQGAKVTKASCRLVIQGHSAGDVQPLPILEGLLPQEELDNLKSTVPRPTEVSLSCTPRNVVSVNVPDNSWLAPYTKNFSGVRFMAHEACAFRANLSSSGAGGMPAGNSNVTQYCAMSVCGGNTSHLQIEFDDSHIESNFFDGDYLASHPYLLCLQGLANVTFSSAVISGNQYVAGVVGNSPHISSIMAVDRGVVFNCTNCLFVQNYGARPLAVWGNASLSQTNISKNLGAIVEDDSDMGAVLVEQGANLHADSCNFSKNAGAYDGSAVYARGVVSIDNCTFNGNEAYHNGGAISGGGAPMRITNSKFDDNVVGVGLGLGLGLGGAVAFIVQGFGMDLSIESCSFSGNGATRGGGIGVQYDMVGGPGDESVGHLLRIVDATMHNNSADEQGSCVSFIVASDEYNMHLLGPPNYSIENSSMTSSSTYHSGATIYLSLQVPSHTLQLDTVTVNDNDGSGLQADLTYNSTLLVTKSQILGNRWVRVSAPSKPNNR